MLQATLNNRHYTFVPLRLRHLPYRGGNKLSLFSKREYGEAGREFVKRRSWSTAKPGGSLDKGGVGVRQSREGVWIGEEFVAAKSRLTAFSVCRAFWYFCATKVHDRATTTRIQDNCRGGVSPPLRGIKKEIPHSVSG